MWLDYSHTAYQVKGITGVSSRIAGAYYRGDRIMDFVNRLKKGTTLYIEAEPNNRHDKNALAVYAYIPERFGYHHVGYVEKALAYQIAVARDKAGIAVKEKLAAKANGLGGLDVEGVIEGKQFNEFLTKYMDKK